MIQPTLCVLALLVCAVPLYAQTAPAPPAVEFLPRAAFHMSAERIDGTVDERFEWDADFGGELDLVDYVGGRVQFVANYEVILGRELRRFDPNQGNYILEGSASARLAPIEIAGVFYHQSRHLSDRPKIFPVDWNAVGARARGAFSAGAFHLDARVDVRGVIKRSFVDYRWELDGRLRADRVVRPGVGLLIGGAVRYVGVEAASPRGGQTGFRAEGGVRFDGGAGAVEFFAGIERRIDPYPLEFGVDTWGLAGFRLLTR